MLRNVFMMLVQHETDGDNKETEANNKPTYITLH